MYLRCEGYREDLELAWEGIVNREKLCQKRILITGATGLIGSFMTDLLLYANEKKRTDIAVSVLARDEKQVKERFASHIGDANFHTVIQDVTEPLKLSHPFDYILHAAGDGFPSAFRVHPVETMTPALFGTYHLLQYAREWRAEKFLYVSSGEVYGKMPDTNHAFVEEDCGYLDSMAVRSCYPAAKRCGETLCASFGQQHHVPVTVVRPSHVYGPCASIRDNRATAQFLNAAAAGKTITLNSPGRQMRSYTYVADSVTGIFTVLLNGLNGEAYNIANKDSKTTIAEFARLLASKAGVRYTVRLPDEEEKGEHTPIEYAVLDASKLEGLGWCGQYNIDRGIEQMLKIRKMV